MSKHWVLRKLTWLFFIIEIHKILINILLLSLRPWNRYKIVDIWICKFGGLFFLKPLTTESVCLLSQVSLRTNSKAIHLAKSIGYSHIYWTLAKSSLLVPIKSNLIIKVCFFKKTRVLKFTVLLCNSCFTCLQHCVGGGKKSRHSEQNVKSREIFRQQQIVKMT